LSRWRGRQTIHGLHLPCSHSSPPFYWQMTKQYMASTSLVAIRGWGHVLFGHVWVERRWRPCIVWSFVCIKEVRNGYKGGGGHVFFAKYNFNSSYIFIKKKSYFPI
jgi:hypothetical protein